MKIKLNKSDIISAALCLMMAVPGAIVFDRLPDRMVTNFSMTGEVNGTSPKAFVVFGLPAVFAAAVILSCIYIRVLDGKKPMGKALIGVQIVLPLIFCLVQGMMLLYSLGKLSDTRFGICLITSLIMLFGGNYLPKIRKNWILGIRTPHILKNDEIWDRTHRFGGYVMMLCGAIGLVLTLMGHFIAAFIVIMAAVLLPAIYGEAVYFISKKR
ncbi:MAG: SdpI family protein [Ruminococcus sp.]|nr:SdpI family protein [Ruminococcus sp.]